MSIVFRNNGLIDLAAATTLGISVKDEGAIGYFGTGVKFGIATVLRLGGSATLWRDGVRHEFGKQPTTARGKDFELVTMDGRELGFTTLMGRNWEAWMAFREFACNALDEGGSYFESKSFDGGTPGETVFVIDCPEITDAYNDRTSFILETDPVWSNDILEIRPGPSGYIFYRGVRIGNVSPPSAHCYNIKRKVDLTEDRTLKYWFERDNAIRDGLLACDDEALIRTALTGGENRLEHSITFDGHAPKPQPAFLRVAASLRGKLDDIGNANTSALRMARDLHLSDLGPQQSISLNPVEQTRFNRACSVLNSAGYDMARYPTVIVDDLGDGVYGLAKEEKIFIAKAAFQKGTKEVASTLLEEWVHLRTGYGDMTRQLQTWLFDELLSQIENSAGEPL